MSNLPSIVSNALPLVARTGMDFLKNSRSQKNILAYKNLELKGMAVTGTISCVNNLIDLGKTHITCKKELNIVIKQTESDKYKAQKEAEVILEKCRIQELEINNQRKIIEQNDKTIECKISILEEIKSEYIEVCSIYGKESLEAKELQNKKFEFMSKFMEV